MSHLIKQKYVLNAVVLLRIVFRSFSTVSSERIRGKLDRNLHFELTWRIPSCILAHWRRIDAFCPRIIRHQLIEFSFHFPIAFTLLNEACDSNCDQIANSIQCSSLVCVSTWNDAFALETTRRYVQNNWIRFDRKWFFALNDVASTVTLDVRRFSLLHVTRVTNGWRLKLHLHHNSQYGGKCFAIVHEIHAFGQLTLVCHI